MRLKIRRYQRETGVISKNILFCLEAQAHFTQEEQNNVIRYRLQNQVIYNSEASKKYLARAEAHRDGSIGGGLRGLALLAMAATKLNITIWSLHCGERVECKSLDELLGAEEAIMAACENLKGYLETAATFDGREVLVEFSGEKPEVVAQAPGPMLPPPLPAPAPAYSAPVAQTPHADIPASAGVAPPPVNAPPAPQPTPAADPDRMPSEQQLGIIFAALIILVVILWLGGHSR